MISYQLMNRSGLYSSNYHNKVGTSMSFTQIGDKLFFTRQHMTQFGLGQC